MRESAIANSSVSMPKNVPFQRTQGYSLMHLKHFSHNLEKINSYILKLAWIN